MRKLCCYLILICLLTTPAFAQSLNPTLQEVFERNGVPYSTPTESIVLLTKQVREAATAAMEAGEFKPGTMLMWPFKPNKTDPTDPNPFRMPKDDWDKLTFMFNQGLAQYGLNIKADMTGTGDYEGILDMTAAVDAGYDNDECTVVNGNVLLNYNDGEGTLYTEGDDFYVRRNAQTEVDRIKLPFVEEEIDGATLMSGADEQSAWSMLRNSFQQDNEHWATAIDLLYEHAKAQPELRPLLSCIFEGGAFPDHYVLTDEDLMTIIKRLVLDLGNDQRFTKALANTDLFHVLMQQSEGSYWYSGFDPKGMDEQQRQLYWTGALSLLSVDMGQQTTQLPDFELRLDDGRVTLAAIWGQRNAYTNYYDGKLDFSYQPTDDGFVARGSLVDRYGSQTLSCNQHDGETSLSLVYVNAHDTDDRMNILATITKKSVRVAFSSSPDNSDAVYGDVELMFNSSGAYWLGGEVKGVEECYSLNGYGNQEMGNFFVDWCHVEDPDDGATQIFRADYTVQPGHVQMHYSYDDRAIDHPIFDHVAVYDYDVEWDDRQFNGWIRNVIGDEGYTAQISAANGEDGWAGDVTIDSILYGVSHPQVSGTFTLRPGDFRADMNLLLGSDDGSRIPAVLTAKWNERTLNAHLNVASLIQSVDLTLGWNPADLQVKFAGDLLGEQFAFEARSQGDLSQRHTHFSADGGTGEKYGVNLDTRVELLDDGWKYHAQLEVVPGGAQMTISGEDHYRLDMQRPNPLVLSQKGTVSYSDGENTFRGNYELNHKLTVDERKHKAPTKPKRISTTTEIPVLTKGDSSQENPTTESIEHQGPEEGVIDYAALEDMLANLSPSEQPDETQAP